ncbi:putative DD41D transposase [Trichonephila clavipes]|nr:putative DD41D transposase [Trichonephila clavipes]
MKEEHITELEDEKWLMKLAFLYDITAQFNDLNLNLYGKNTCKQNSEADSDDVQVRVRQRRTLSPRRFVEWAQKEIAVVPDFHKRILFSDEEHIWLNGYVNQQNCRIWSEANPQVYVETPLHPEKLTVWCALWAGGIIGPYFFKNDEGHNVKVNGDRYKSMITNFFIPELNNHDIQELWF